MTERMAASNHVDVRRASDDPPMFELAERGTAVRTEVLGGVATFLTMSYIVFVNPAILSAPPGCRSRRSRSAPRSARRSSPRSWAW